MPLNFRAITGKWSLPNGGVPERALATLTLTEPDWIPDAFVVPDVIRLVVDEDGDVVPARGYTGQTIEVDGKDRAVIWTSEDGERQVTYRVRVSGELSSFQLVDVLIPVPSGAAPITLQQILELGIAPTDPRYLTILSFIEGLFRGEWDSTQSYSRGQQVRRGAAVYIASDDIGPGVDPLDGPPWSVYLIDAGIPPGGDTNAVLAKLSPVSSEAGWTNTPTFKRVALDTTNVEPLLEAGQMHWDDLDQALAYRTDGITVDIAQENLVYVRNPSGGATLPKGAVVSVQGASANRIEVALCSATVGGDGCRTLGVVMGDIPSPGFGFVSTFGLLRGFNTTQILGTVTAGSEIFVSATPGVMTTVVPEAPGRKVTVGYVVTTGTNGSIFVTVRRSRRVQELDDVHAPSPLAGQVIRRNPGNTRYENVTLGPSDVGADPSGSAAGVQSNLDAHTGASTNVHGIANTADLVVTTDARLSDQRTPLDGSVTDAKIVVGGLSPTAITGTAVITTDGRLSDQRTPLDGSVTDAKVSATANIADTKLAQIATAGKVANSATTATASNSPNTIMLRGAAGEFAAGAATVTELRVNGDVYQNNILLTLTSQDYGLITGIVDLSTDYGSIA